MFDKLIARRQVWLSLILAVILAAAAIGYQAMLKEVTIAVNDDRQEIATFKPTVKELLQEQGISLAPGDLVRPNLDAHLEDGLEVSITRAFEVKIVDGKTVITRKTTPASVETLLAAAGITLNEQDQVNPGQQAVIGGPTQVTVTRIAEELITTQEKLEPSTIYQNDPDLEKGLTVVAQKGQAGLREKTIKITYANGQETGRQVVKEKVIKEPQPKIVRRGTLQLASREGQELQFREVREVVATAYSPTGNNTYTGTRPKKGTVAVDPGVIPLGTKLYIENYGYGRAEDIGSAIKGNRIDLFFGTEAEALKWGRKSVKVYILQ